MLRLAVKGAMRLSAVCMALAFCASADAASPGIADTEFGADGVTTTTLLTGAQQTESLGGAAPEGGGANAVAVQPDGKIVIAGQTGITGHSAFGAARYLPDGSLDPTFGDGGTVTVEIGTTSMASGMLLDPDGRIVLVGVALFDDLRFAAVRLLPGGDLDPSFSDDGVFTHRIGLASLAMALARAPDGKILIGGTAKVREDPTAVNKLQKLAFAAIRLKDDGTLDTSFGSGGEATVPMPSSAYAMTLQPDGNLVLGGSTYVDGKRAFAAARLTPSGGLDSSFGEGGIVKVPIGAEAVATALAIEPDGGLVLAGQAFTNTTVTAAIRLRANGELDPSFGSGGIATSFTGRVGPNWMIRQPDGKFLIAGTDGLSAVRLRSDGALDDSFGTGGVARARWDAGKAAANALALQPNGMIVLAGAAFDEAGTARFAVARLDNDVDVPPVAENDRAELEEFAPPTRIDVLQNDNNPYRNAMEIEAVSDPPNGVAEIAADGSALVYTPDFRYCNDSAELDTFSYTLAGGSSASVGIGVACDWQPPETVIRRAPSRPTRTSSRAPARFRFAADEPAHHYRCRLDRAQPMTCGPPLRRMVPVGRHRIFVRAIDRAGNVDPTPAVYGWRVVGS
jgi:uncharacterized delta-60 repeat protein